VIYKSFFSSHPIAVVGSRIPYKQYRASLPREWLVSDQAPARNWEIHILKPINGSILHRGRVTECVFSLRETKRQPGFPLFLSVVRRRGNVLHGNPSPDFVTRLPDGSYLLEAVLGSCRKEGEYKIRIEATNAVDSPTEMNDKQSIIKHIIYSRPITIRYK
jgi:hypothetical protein